MSNRRETPRKRLNPSGKIVWMARWTDDEGNRHVGVKPDIPGTYEKKGPCKSRGTFTCCAQHAIDECHRRDSAGLLSADTVGGYAATWFDNHPRSPVTDRTNRGRLRAILGVEVEGKALRDWPYALLRRRHVSALVTHMLVEEKRAVLGVRGILQTLSAMTEDALTDEIAVGNPFKGVKVRVNDPRIRKQAKPKRVWEWEQMHTFAAACGVMAERKGVFGPSGEQSREYRANVGEAMARILSDGGLRIGELLAVRRQDLHLDRGVLEVRQTLTEFGIEAGTKRDKLMGITDPVEQGRVVPLTPELCEILKAMPKRIDSLLLFPAPLGGLWWYGQFLKDVWAPAQARCGLDPTPHEFRHSVVSHMRAAGVNDEDLAKIMGHSVSTMIRGYSHSLGRSNDVFRKAVGS